MNPDAFVFINSILYVTMGILGGMGYLAGAGIGGAMMALLPELLRGAAEYKDFLTGLMLLLLLIFLPRGVMGLIDQMLIQPTARAGPPSPQARPARTEAVTRRAESSEVLLESRGLTKNFGGLRAVQDV